MPHTTATARRGGRFGAQPARRIGIVAAIALGASSLQPTAAQAAGSLTAMAIADTFVTAANPNATNGRAATARADDTPKISYFKFTVTSVPVGAPVTGASLVLTGVGSQI